MRGCGAILLWTTTVGRPIFVEAMPAKAQGGSPSIREAVDNLHNNEEPKVVSFTEGILSLISPIWAAHDAQPDENDNNDNNNQDGGMEVLGHDDVLGAHDTRDVASAGEWKELGVTELLSASSLFSPAVSAANFVLEQRQSSDDDNDDGDESSTEPDDENDVEELYLCSNPNFDTTCGEGCACASVPVTPEIMSYGGKPPCAALPYTLRPGNPQGVSSARAYSKWNCTLFAGQYCEEDTPPAESLVVPPGPPGLNSLGGFDDLAQSYRCVALS